jgi:TonB family protein
MKKLLFLGLLSCMVIGFLFAQKVNNLRSVMDPNSGNYIISFDLEGEADEHYQLSLMPYNDEIEIAEAKIRSIYGAVSSLAPGIIATHPQEDETPVYFYPYEDVPIPITRISPVYPEFARRNRIQGTVVLELEILKDGSIRNIVVRRSVPGLDEAAIEAVRKVRFIPGQIDGKPIDTLLIVPLEFKLDDETTSGFVSWDKPPVLIGSISPVYPDSARVNGVQGTVVLEVEILKDGSIRDIHVRRSVPGLDEAAIEAVRKARFEPALSEGKPIDVKLHIPVEFKLD